MKERNIGVNANKQDKKDNNKVITILVNRFLQKSQSYTTSH